MTQLQIYILSGWGIALVIFAMAFISQFGGWKAAFEVLFGAAITFAFYGSIAASIFYFFKGTL